MAKQSGIHQLKGKIEGVSYYRQKGVESGLARTINQGMSRRVKEDAGYLNTRLNAAEFGSAGSFAGACIRSISERQRTMLKDFATGSLAKDVKKIIALDTTNPWGQRSLQGANWQAEMLERISGYAKIDFLSNVGGVWDTEVSADGGGFSWTPNAELPSGWGGLLQAKGASGAFVEMYAYRAKLLPQGEASGKGFSEVSLIGTADIVIGEAGTITSPATLSAAWDGMQAANTLTGVLVVVKPYQKVNNVAYIRQELCTFQLVGVQKA